VAGVSLVSLWQTAIIVLLALVPGAAYVSIINDVTDREDDLVAGKRNRMAGRSPTTIALLLLATTTPGLVFCWLWRDDVHLLTAYLCAWLVYSLYSLPPFRFKTRGILGVLCDASGAHLFPTLVAVLLVFRDTHQPPRLPWVVAVAVWSFAYGLRGILWHQLSDREHDLQSNVRTFAQRHPAATTERLATFLVFPLELASLIAILLQLHTLWPWLFLAVYAYLAFRKKRYWAMNPVIVVTKPRFFIVLHEYYDVYLPLAILISAAIRHPLDAIAIAVHLTLFPQRALQAWRDAQNLRPRFR
jgi:4-hydroxybenzoate polyprenyltransferase